MRSNARFRASYYNMRVPHGAKTLLFNGVTGALMKLDRKMTRELAPWLGEDRPRTAGTGYAGWKPAAFARSDLPAAVADRFEDFLAAGIFVPAGCEEREDLRLAYRRNRSAAPFFVTITTTLDCNMRCYYCYQKAGVLEKMSWDMGQAIAGWMEREIEERGHRGVYVDWYGGEPMLNQDVIERFSARMTAFCDTRNVAYKGSMICNGTAWPQDKAGFVKRNRIDSIQFSLDGPARHQNKRRSMVGAGSSGRVPSFDEVMDTIAAVIGHTKVYLRVNVDPWIGWSCLEVLDECETRGWLGPETQFYPYVAIINAMTEHCGFIGKIKRFEDFQAEFSEIERSFYAKLGRFRDEKTFEIVQYYPNRVDLNCAAVSNNAVVFGPNGRMYKCGLDVGDDQRAHAALTHDGAVAANSLSDPALAPDRWDCFDPFQHSRCSECQYLPVCMGGCPKAQIERDEKQVRLQSDFWENNFDRVIRGYYVAASGR